jgi:hypothetical protein
MQPEVLIIVFRSSPLISFLNQINLLHTLTTYFFNIHLILSSYLCLSFSNDSCYRSLVYPMLVTWSPVASFFSLSLKCSVTVGNYDVVQFSPSVRSKYTPKYPVIKHPLSMFFFRARDQVSRPYKTTGKTTVLYIWILISLDRRRE